MVVELQNFAVQSLYSYRGLFLWSSWWSYTSNVVLGPILTLIIVALVGSFAGRGADLQSHMLGIATFSIPFIVSGGIHQSFYYDRVWGTLSTILGSPVNRTALFFSRGILHGCNGLISVTATLGFAWAFLGLNLGQAEWVSFSLAVLATICSTVMFMLCTGMACVISKDWFMVRALSMNIILVLAGVVIPKHELTFPLAAVGQILPLTHGLEVMRSAVGAASVQSTPTELLAELGIAAAYGCLALVVLRWIEWRAKQGNFLESGAV